MRGQRYSDQEMLDDLRRVAAEVGGKLSRPVFIPRGAISAPAIENRFGGWLAALRMAGLESPFRFGGIWFPCPICGASFRSNNGQKSKRTCGPDCRRESRFRNGNWKGNEASLQAARGRAEKVIPHPVHCERCQHDGSESRLERHHRDRDVYNNVLENLEVLCDRCHTEEHRGEKRRHRKKK